MKTGTNDERLNIRYRFTRSTTTTNNGVEEVTGRVTPQLLNEIFVSEPKETASIMCWYKSNGKRGKENWEI